MKKETIMELLGLALESKSETPPTFAQPLEMDKAYLIRTVTLYYTGRVKEYRGKFVVLEDAAWIADTGRYNEAVKEGKFSEVEPVEDIIINTDSIIDAVEITYKLPRKVK